MPAVRCGDSTVARPRKHNERVLVCLVSTDTPELHVVWDAVIYSHPSLWHSSTLHHCSMRHPSQRGSAVLYHRGTPAEPVLPQA